MATDRGWLQGGRSLDEDWRLGARALGLLFLAGATIGLVSLQLPHPRRADLPGLYSNVALAYAGALALLLAAAHVRAWMLQLAVAAGSLLITRAVLLSGESMSYYSVWYIWVDVYAFYFFSRRVAISHVAFVAALYGATLLHDPPTSPVASWLTTVATLVVAGLFIDTLVTRARRQATTAAASVTTMARLTELGHELAGLSDPTAVRLAVCQGAIAVNRASRCVLWEPHRDGSGLRVTAGAVAPDRDPVPFGGSSSALQEAFAGGETVRRCAVERGPGGDGERGPGRGGERGPGGDGERGSTRAVGRGGEPSELVVTRLWRPIVHERQTLGVLELSWDDPSLVDDPSVVAVADLLAVSVAVTLQRIELLAELEASARTDELTALPNRRAWHEQLPRELNRASRHSQPLSLAMLDLDHFKRYNDARGHQTGDRLLKQVAALWSAELRPTDTLSRLGGEEFALALPACPPHEALIVVERLRAAIPDGQSCSAGIATWDGSETAAELLDRADRALYRAKRSGRDRSAVAEPVRASAAGDLAAT
ncbi:MAG TPA: GGDEF domain-containing protein [Solirubrobacteraceae bacterium]|jgi:diguanylate cyclase (GGDEF)-like protein